MDYSKTIFLLAALPIAKVSRRLDFNTGKTDYRVSHKTRLQHWHVIVENTSTRLAHSLFRSDSFLLIESSDEVGILCLDAILFLLIGSVG